MTLRRRMLLMATVGLSGVGYVECGGQIDDGWDGLSKGGDTDALSPPGTPAGLKCVGYDAALWNVEVPCQDRFTCDASAYFPPGWPPDMNVAQCNGSTCQLFASDIPTEIGCYTTQYCEAWVEQYVKGITGPADIGVYCSVDNSGRPGGCVFDICNTQLTPCSNMCIMRDGGWRCETPCQDPNGE